MDKPFFSVAIPTYEMYGNGVKFLENNFIKLEKQTFNDFEVVISDHSLDNGVMELCKKWGDRLVIKYFKNTIGIGKSSSNINYALKKCRGEWIKIIFQDDFLVSNESLEIIHRHIKNSDNIKWVITACEHTTDGVTLYRPFYPKWNDKIHTGINTFSSPSVLTIKNNYILLFNEELVWLMDVDYYKRMYDKYGEPYYIMDINVVNRIWGNSVSNTLSNEIKQKETRLMINIHGE